MRNGCFETIRFYFCFIVFVFSPGSSKPVYTAADVVKADCKVLGATFVPSLYANDSNLNWYERSHLFFINSCKVNQLSKTVLCSKKLTLKHFFFRNYIA